MRASLASFFVAAACTTEPEFILGAAGEGDACKQISDCEAGLECKNKLCVKIPVPADGPRAGDACTGATDCGPDLFCGRQNVCTATAPLAAGSPCGISEQCAAPLVCGGDGTCRADDGSAGTAAFGEDCSEFTDCQRPYICGLTGTCVKLPSVTGADCSANDRESGAFRAYYEVPRGEPTGNTDFYRLPFPNDIRVRADKPYLAGHPSPGDVLGVDVTKLYLTAVEQDTDGFATNQPIFFRFTDQLDHSTVCLASGGIYPVPAEGDAPFCPTPAAASAESIYLVNIDTDSPAYNQRQPVELGYGKEHGQFICGNWWAIAPRAGEPLRQGTTYAAVVTTAVKSKRGDVPIQDQDFAALLATTAPTEPPELVAAYGKLAPLRAWLTARSIDPATIAAAAVFTTGTPTATGAKLRTVVRARTGLAFNNDAVLCNTGVVSPCEDGLTGVLTHQRGCFPAQAAFHEVQGTYNGPVFQAGTRPYKTAADGGAIAFDASGNPVVQGTESMCYSLALPKTTMPAGGWPVVVYGHGTGGGFRSHAYDGTAALLTGLGFAVLGFDNVMHGKRQGKPPAQWEDPGQLFFNAQNPRASRDNILQGAADLYHLVALLETATVTSSLGTADFDATKIFYYGHSQGTVISPAFIANEKNVRATFQSGAGAELALSILFKSEPAAVSEGVGALFGDRSIARMHPMMGIFAMLFGGADSVNYARAFVLEPPAGRTAAPYFQIYGIGDHFAPEETQAALIRAAGIPMVGTQPEPLAGIATAASPATGNLAGITAGAVQYAPDGSYDGHFVAYQLAAARAAIAKFFQTALTGAPTIQR